MLVPSKFNIFLSVEDTKYVYNSRNGALVKINDDFLKVINNPERTESSDLKTKMFEMGFLVRDDLDEVEVLKFEHNKAKFSNEQLTLTILPTEDCNFRCFYCFEDKHPSLLANGFIDNIKKFVSEKATGVKAIKVCWFGGEPLLNSALIYKLSEFFIDYANDHNIEYRAVMISNGYLINDLVAEKLKSCKIDVIQITVDGDSDTHNKRRPLKNGGETFDKILNNIEIITKKDIRVLCRINLDKSNLKSVEKLLEIFGEKQFKNFQINFGQVLPLGKDDSWNDYECLNSEEFAQAIAALGERMKKDNLALPEDYPFYPKPLNNFCGANQINSFVIYPNGKIGKCYDCKELFVGDLSSSDNLTQEEKNNLVYWMNHDPFSDEECIHCKVLPLCMGSCPYMKKKFANKFCVLWKDNIITYLEKLITLKLK